MMIILLECHCRIGSEVRICTVLLGIQKDVSRCGRLKWFEHLEHKSVDDWVLACRNVEVAGVKCRYRGRETCGEYVKNYMKLIGLQPE